MRKTLSVLAISTMIVAPTYATETIAPASVTEGSRARAAADLQSIEWMTIVVPVRATEGSRARAAAELQNTD